MLWRNFRSPLSASSMNEPLLSRYQSYPKSRKTDKQQRLCAFVWKNIKKQDYTISVLTKHTWHSLCGTPNIMANITHNTLRCLISSIISCAYLNFMVIFIASIPTTRMAYVKVRPWLLPNSDQFHWQCWLIPIICDQFRPERFSQNWVEATSSKLRPFLTVSDHFWQFQTSSDQTNLLKLSQKPSLGETLYVDNVHLHGYKISISTHKIRLWGETLNWYKFSTLHLHIVLEEMHIIAGMQF